MFVLYPGYSVRSFALIFALFAIFSAITFYPLTRIY
ncbi:Protein of unknown function [Bacillus cytotoxicus]|uniref:Uncharacterized protein n=1 Tax=Bacillus cytotoxicus TaxID=580165 RepID=A0AAX2CGN8_9BACI|nr:Protein of unknown function [Bacillus cytotoxicus]SCN35506.1 Protein of unknown function [Bacillus cytotoxicus]